MSDKIETDYGTAEAEWIESKLQWEIKLFPKKLSDRRPLYKKVSDWLYKKNMTHTILQQRNNQLRVVAWNGDRV